MESILSLFIFHDSYVVSFLVVGITVVVVMLLLFNQKSPTSVVRSEVEDDGQIEGALRRVLSEKQWVGATGSVDSGGSGDSARVDALEEEVLVKDRTIAELNKKLTQGGGGGGGAAAESDDTELLAKIAELEERLQEYEIIEDDIADLSLYRTENEKLKEELEHLKQQLGDGGVEANIEPEVETNVEVVEPEDEKDEGRVVAPAPQKNTKVQGADLVAEFEKVVNSQEQMDDEGETDVLTEEVDNGQVVVAQESSGDETKVTVHPKLQNVAPDSKEEAEVFVKELNSLKEGLKSE